MTAKTTKCPYCRRRYQQASAYEKHLQTIYLDIVLSLSAIADATSRVRTTFVPDQSKNLTDSDYESHPELETTDFHTASGVIDDMWNSDTEDTPHLPVCGHPLSGQETIRGAGRPLGKVLCYTQLNKAITDDLWSPFASESDFNLDSWFVQSKVAKSEIDMYFAKGLGDTNSE